MAWPCISRVCCLAQFWNQFDKSDLSVPLTLQNYSEITDQEIRSVTGHVPAERAPKRGDPSAEHGDSSAAQDANRAGRRRAEPSYKPREDAPFPSVTQYKQDYKPWPIPKKDNFPWISNGVGKSSPVRQQQPRAGREERAVRPRRADSEAASTSSYR